MPRDDFRANEKRWRRRRLFRERRTHPILRLIIALLCVAALAGLAMWLKVSPFSLFPETVVP